MAQVSCYIAEVHPVRNSRGQQSYWNPFWANLLTIYRERDGDIFYTGNLTHPHGFSYRFYVLHRTIEEVHFEFLYYYRFNWLLQQWEIQSSIAL